MKKKLLSFALALIMALSLLPMAAFAEAQKIDTSNVTWELSGDSKTLTIGGTGEMPNFTDESGQPWKDNRTSITTVKIESGVTAIGKYAFRGCTGLTGVTIPASVTIIGSSAFDGCSELANVTVKATTPPALNSHLGEVFNNCANPLNIIVPSGAAYQEVTYWKDIANVAFVQAYVVDIALAANGTATAEFEAHSHVAGGHHDEIPATCTEDGSFAYNDCTDVNCTYKLVGDNWVAAEETIDPATGHSFTGAIVSNDDGTHSFKCVHGDCTAKGVMDGETPVVYVADEAGYEVCVDEDVKDHKCDKCGYVLSVPITPVTPARTSLVELVKAVVHTLISFEMAPVAKTLAILKLLDSVLR